VDQTNLNDPFIPPPAAAAEVSEEDRLLDEGKIPAMLAYVPFLCFWALFLKRDNPYAYHHGKQGLILLLAELAILVLRFDLIWNLMLILIGAVAIWGMVTAFRGVLFKLPVVSDLLDHYQP